MSYIHVQHLVVVTTHVTIHVQFQEECEEVFSILCGHIHATRTRLTINILEPNTCKYFSKKKTRKSDCKLCSYRPCGKPGNEVSQLPTAI